MDESGQSSGLFSTLLSSVAKGFGGALGNSLSQGSAPQATQAMPGGPSNADIFNDARFNGSGWVVSTGKSYAKGTSTTRDAGMTPTLTSDYGLVGSMPGQGGLDSLVSWPAIALIFVVILALKR